MLRILGRASSINVRKVLWTCAELELPFAREDWGQGFQSTQSVEFLALNPNATIPVIQDGDFVLWESNAIIRYLAARYPHQPLYPSEATDRARVDQWMDWQSSSLNQAWTYAFMGLVKRSALHQDIRAQAASSREWTKLMTILNHQLQATQAYVAGKAFTLADIPIGLAVQRWFSTPLDHPDLPAVRDYYERLQQRSAYLLYGCNGQP